MSYVSLICFLLLVGSTNAGSEEPNKVVDDETLQLNIDKLSDTVQQMSEDSLRWFKKSKYEYQEISNKLDQLTQRVLPMLEEYEAKKRHDEKEAEAERLQNETQYAREHFEEVSTTDFLLNLTIDQMKVILESDQVNVTSEDQVYEALMRWIRADEDSRLGYLPDLLDLIRLMLIDGKYLLRVISKDPIIVKCTPCRALIEEVILLQLDPTTALSRAVPALINRKVRRITTKEIDEPLKPNMKEVILAIGGDNGGDALASVELFDPSSPRWRNATSIVSGKRRRFGAAVMDNMVYVCGGYGDASPKSCISYDPLTNSWNTSIADMSVDRADFALAALDGHSPGGGLYAVGGYGGSKSVEYYNSSIKNWFRRRDFEIKIYNQAIASLNGYLYMAGGDVGYGKKTYSLLYRYDPLTDSWMQLRDMPTTLAFHALVATRSSSDNQPSSGYLYAVGGSTGDKYLDSVLRFSVEINQWDSIERGAMQELWHPGAVLLESHLYVVGGFSSAATNAVEVISLTKDGAPCYRWCYKMIEPRWSHAVVKVQIPIN